MRLMKNVALCFTFQLLLTVEERLVVESALNYVNDGSQGNGVSVDLLPIPSSSSLADLTNTDGNTSSPERDDSFRFHQPTQSDILDVVPVVDTVVGNNITTVVPADLPTSPWNLPMSTRGHNCSHIPEGASALLTRLQHRNLTTPMDYWTVSIVKQRAKPKLANGSEFGIRIHLNYDRSARIRRQIVTAFVGQHSGRDLQSTHRTLGLAAAAPNASTESQQSEGSTESSSVSVADAAGNKTLLRPEDAPGAPSTNSYAKWHEAELHVARNKTGPLDWATFLSAINFLAEWSEMPKTYFSTLFGIMADKAGAEEQSNIGDNFLDSPLFNRSY